MYKYMCVYIYINKRSRRRRKKEKKPRNNSSAYESTSTALKTAHLQTNNAHVIHIHILPENQTLQDIPFQSILHLDFNTPKQTTGKRKPYYQLPMVHWATFRAHILYYFLFEAANKFGPTTNIRFRLGTLKRKECYQHCSSMSMLALSDDSINWQAIRSTNCAMRRVKTVTSRHSWLNKPAVTPANSDKKSNHGSIIILSAS